MKEQVRYTGHFVKDSDALLKQIPPQISGEGVTVYAHHVTREYKPASGTAEITPGEERTLMAIGEVVMGGVHAVLVESPDGKKISTKKHPHITIATAPGVAPVKSDEVLEAAHEAGTIKPIEPPIPVPVVEGYYDGRQVVTDSPTRA